MSRPPAASSPPAHSYGANTTLLAASAQVLREGRRLVLRDPRLQAAIVISAPPFRAAPAAAQALPTPQGHVARRASPPPA